PPEPEELATAYPCQRGASDRARHPECFPAGLPDPAGHPVEVWNKLPTTRATEETRGFAPARGGVLDHASLGRVIAAHGSDLRGPAAWRVAVQSVSELRFLQSL